MKFLQSNHSILFQRSPRFPSVFILIIAQPSNQVEVLPIDRLLVNQLVNLIERFFSIWGRINDHTSLAVRIFVVELERVCGEDRVAAVTLRKV